ncbi:pyrroline-5-carboxylate reductase [Bacillus massiliglaciei]|uniref:pyrroline-5-carboxylate reductase n=1 Tax=Bacillus massiliglaciei TaxID=1816693 RepID=UPI000A581FD0|nr:pyrroline-5-carboxylate reductase [Bacillus massiliglaciei]
MKDIKIGFIGFGKMGQAIAGGMIRSNLIPADNIKISARSEKTLQKAETVFGIKGTLENKEVARFADLLFLGIQPGGHKNVLEEVKRELKDDVTIITMAAGIVIKTIEAAVGRKVKVVRTMPNTPSMVREGMTAMSVNDHVSERDLSIVREILQSLGETVILEEELMDAVPAVSGSSPAFVYMFIEALGDGAVRDGIPRKEAYKMAAQAVLGAAKMVLESGRHPGELKDDVCTPGGSTIQAVAALEKNGFRASVLEAMEACTKKSKSIGR